MFEQSPPGHMVKIKLTGLGHGSEAKLLSVQAWVPACEPACEDPREKLGQAASGSPQWQESEAETGRSMAHVGCPA